MQPLVTAPTPKLSEDCIIEIGRQLLPAVPLIVKQFGMINKEFHLAIPKILCRTEIRVSRLSEEVFNALNGVMYLHLAIKSIDTESSQRIANLPHLHSLSLSGKSVTPNRFEPIKRNASLRKLTLSNTKMAGTKQENLMTELVGMTQLDNLTLNDPKVSLEDLKKLSTNVPSFRRLNLLKKRADIELLKNALPEVRIGRSNHPSCRR